MDNAKGDTQELENVDDLLAYEDEVMRNPCSVKHWLRYIEYRSSAPFERIFILYERALREVPGSYKLWHAYLLLYVRSLHNVCRTDAQWERACQLYERCLAHMYHMPRIWLEYCQLMCDRCLVTRTRHVFDQCLRALPVTQHHRVWCLYLKFADRHAANLPDMAVQIYKRYMKLCSEHTERFVDLLLSIGRYDQAALQLSRIVQNDSFVSQHGKSQYQLWNELCDMVVKHSASVVSLDVDAIIRCGLARYTDQLGRLWNSLADYYIRRALPELARDVYEEAIQTVSTVRDFTQVFDAYAQFEEASLQRHMQRLETDETKMDADRRMDLELRLARFERLIERRPLLLNSVLLRQNPHNVLEWHKRVQLFADQPLQVVKTFTEAVQTVDAKLATGQLHTLWVEFAKYYEKVGQLDDSRAVLEKATQVPFTKVDDLACVWCEWCEMEVRNGHYTEALRLIRMASTPVSSHKVAYFDRSQSVQCRLHKSLKVWSFHADLEESFGSFQTCKSVYERIIDLKIATPQIIINYGMFLEENSYFEEAFRCYEKGIGLFKWPYVFDIWQTYLTKFIKRFGGSKLERLRDLFEQCLDGCPAEHAMPFYMLYGQLEEQHGLARHAMAVYSRAVEAVVPANRKQVIDLYLERTAELSGLASTRHVYEQALEVLDDDAARDMCLRFAQLECRLGEIDRARAIYGYCSQLCEPRLHEEFWRRWRQFEVEHGNEDTVREMVRIKRSVQASYSTHMLSGATADLLTDTSGTRQQPHTDTQTAELPETAGVQSVNTLAAPSARLKSAGISFVRASSSADDVQRAEQARVVNPAEIQLGEDDEDEDEENEDDREDVGVETIVERQIPESVFT